MKAGIITVILLVISNVFMTAAWYGNLKLKEMHISTDWPLILVILASWGVALIEYFFMIPANTIGSKIHRHRNDNFQQRSVAVEPCRFVRTDYRGSFLCLP